MKNIEKELEKFAKENKKNLTKEEEIERDCREAYFSTNLGGLALENPLPKKETIKKLKKTFVKKAPPKKDLSKCVPLSKIVDGWEEK